VGFGDHLGCHGAEGGAFFRCPPAESLQFIDSGPISPLTR
jgi:hypothetical protein